MRHSVEMNIILTISSLVGFLSTYFLDIAFDSLKQFMAIILVILLDGIFGVISGIKKEGFRTFKALKILKSIVTWVAILTVLLSIEKAFPFVSWLSESIIVPFIIFEIISALKNASMAGLVKQEFINEILDRIDTHKGKRK
jgi:phage-related holin